MNTSTRLRLATRIHFGLLRHLGEGVDVGRMLKNEHEAREALWVCEALGDSELRSLARQFVQAGVATSTADVPPVPGHTAQDTAWARDTSGFGFSTHGEAIESQAGAAAAKGWFQPASWLRSAARNPR